MSEKDFARRLIGVVHASVAAKSKPALALMEWVKAERHWLWPGAVWARGKNGDADLPRLGWAGLPTLIETIAADDERASVMRTGDAIAALLAFDDTDRALLDTMIGLHRLPRVAALRSRLDDAGLNLAATIASLAAPDGALNDSHLRASAPAMLGILFVELGRSGRLIVETTWTLDKLLDRDACDEEAVAAALLGPRQATTLGLADFDHLGTPIDLLRRLLAGAATERRPGINILFHGPPGTGKTELARALAAAASLSLHAVGESDDYGDEPDREHRVTALRLSQRVLARRGKALLLFDEMEDFIGSARRGAGGDWMRRDGSKIFSNRMLETNAVPTIWTTNSIDNVDPAYLRRMSFILKVDHPPRNVRARIVATLAAAEHMPLATGALTNLVGTRAAAAGVVRDALGAARLAGGGEEDAAGIATSLVDALDQGSATTRALADLDLDLYESDPPVSTFVARLADGPSDFSLLLTGPPGTGKTALAGHIADRLGRELIVKRASDILSKWVGETEGNIADAFRAAAETKAVLFFDEIDSLLADRSSARQSWEVSQVNELLTALDSHVAPVIAATNFLERLDPAAMRRFIFKLALKPMSADRAALAFRRFFDADAPSEIAHLRGLTAGDFAVVARQLRYRPPSSPRDIAALLAAEVAARPGSPIQAGF